LGKKEKEADPPWMELLQDAISASWNEGCSARTQPSKERLGTKTTMKKVLFPSLGEGKGVWTTGRKERRGTLKGKETQKR